MKKYSLTVGLTLIGLLFLCASGYAQKAQDPQVSPFKIQLSLISITRSLWGHPTEQVTVSTKITNISNKEQKVTTLGCSDDWVTDNPQISFNENCMSTMLFTQILKPKEAYIEKHFLGVESMKGTLVFRLGFRNLKEDSWGSYKKDYGKAIKYMGRTWSDPLSINLSTARQDDRDKVRPNNVRG